jgi:hypothetical protein
MAKRKKQKHARESGEISEGIRSYGKIRGLGGEVKRPATRSKHQGSSFADNLTGKRYS